jgi:uncharacterized protein with PIN domain
MKFLVDAMLGKLARFLRIFGYDTVYADDLTSIYNVDPVPDEKLLEFALENKRIIITKDLSFYAKNEGSGVLIEGEGVYNYLQQLKSKLNLQFNFEISKGRCSVCNGTLIKVDNKNSIKHLIQPESFKHYSEFYQCSNSECQKIFWEGPHITDIISKTKKFVNNN